MESDAVLKVEASEMKTSCVVWFFSVSSLKERNDNNMGCSATVYLLHQVTVVVLLYLVLVEIVMVIVVVLYLGCFIGGWVIQLLKSSLNVCT